MCNDTTPSSPEVENARLKAEIAFLKKKLQIVGSVTRHDVLNQMTAILGYNELLGMMVGDEKLRSFLVKERQALDKIRRQFRFAKDYQNIGAEPPGWQNLNTAVNRVREAFDAGKIRITALTGDAAILADPLFETALFELFENTLRHGGTATEIRLTLQEEGSHALITIEDNGSGIPPEETEKIFERGYGKSAGLGLFLAREILAVTGITIAENGEPGKGARFVLMLPAGTFRISGGG